MATIYKRGGKGSRRGSYYIAYFDHTGTRVVKSARTTDKATAGRIAAKLEAEAALRRDGVIDPTLDAVSQQSQRSIESHLDDYEAYLVAANRTEEHIRRTLRIIRQIVTSAGFTLACDIHADGVNRYAGCLKRQGKSARTIQSHLTAIKGFTKWLTDHHKLPRDPLAGIRKPNPKADRRRRRRMLLPEEWAYIQTALADGEERFGVSADERLLLYRTAIQTGLRSSELRCLTKGRLFLDSVPPYILCRAGSTKNRLDARQYIDAELAADLRLHVASKDSEEHVFRMPHDTNMAKMLRQDVEAARRMWLEEAADDQQTSLRRTQSDFLAQENERGEVLDFHSLRHTCGAWLALTGAHPKVIQAVMRHSTITLTMDTYGHLFPGQEAEAVARLTNMLKGNYSQRQPA